MPIFKRLSNQARGAFYGWRMVAAGSAFPMLGRGFYLYGFAAQAKPNQS